jgi:uncharacterized membrane protein
MDKGKRRLEAFSDGALAIIITIMVLEMKIPSGDDLSALSPLIPVFFSYGLSFIYIGIYWNNHHYMLLPTQRRRRRDVAVRSCLKSTDRGGRGWGPK